MTAAVEGVKGLVKESAGVILQQERSSADTLHRRYQREHDFYCRSLLKVRPRGGGEPVALVMNRAQRYVHELLEGQLQATGRVRAIILKGRKVGVSTYVQSRFFRRTTLWPGIRATILTHEDAATRTIFDMAKLFFAKLPPGFRPAVQTKNSNELTWSAIGGGYGVATAGSQDTGRSQTAQLFHGSECAFWPSADTHFRGIAQTVSTAKGTEIILESTANGIGNEFHERWQAAESGQSEYIPIFVPWFWDDECRLEVPPNYLFTIEDRVYQNLHGLDDQQLYWRRVKIDGDFKADESWFRQEYPATSAEAFLAPSGTFLQADVIMRARKAETPVHMNPVLVMGVDPKRFGDDRFGIAWRRGRVVVRVEGSAIKLDTMEAAGWIGTLIKRDKPHRVFIDVVGLGAGVFDRLVEMGYSGIVVSVEGGARADEERLYQNKRVECWARLRDWLNEIPQVKIPDSDELHADLQAPLYKYESNQRLKLESKDDMRKRKIRSPDLADALALTFAYNVEPPKTADFHPVNQITYEEVPWQVL